MKLLHTGTVQNGKMQFDNRTMLDHHIKELEGKRFGFELGEEDNTRTARQNRYLWGVCYPVVVEALRDLGEDEVNKDVVHIMLTRMFLEPTKFYVKLTKEVVTEYSSRKLSKRQFNDYTEKIQRWAAEVLKIYIPDPNEEIHENIS